MTLKQTQEVLSPSVLTNAGSIELFVFCLALAFGAVVACPSFLINRFLKMTD